LVDLIFNEIGDSKYQQHPLPHSSQRVSIDLHLLIIIKKDIWNILAVKMEKQNIITNLKWEGAVEKDTKIFTLNSMSKPKPENVSKKEEVKKTTSSKF
jgi:hypothetical protein